MSEGDTAADAEQDRLIRVGMIGVGRMGGTIARRLLETGGVEVYAYDVDRDRVADLEPYGAIPEPAISSLAQRCTTVCVTVVDDAQTAAVIDALVAAGGVTDLALIHATLRPSTCVDLGLRALGAGIAVLDVPVSGGAERAAIGELLALVGGDQVVLDRARVVLDRYCSSIVRVGELGAGQVAKLVNNLMSIVNTVVVGEALQLAAAHGLDPGLALSVASLGSGASNAVATWSWRSDVVREGANRMRDMARKDLRLALDLAAQSGLTLSLTTVADRTLGELDC